MTFQLECTYASLPSIFFKEVSPGTVKSPSLFIWNESLSEELQLTSLPVESRVSLFSGNSILQETKPIAMAYAGHQFGNFTMLGDGRAILMGEIISRNGERMDVQWKGSGRTPFSRGGDGRATLSSMLREYIMSEAMHYLGIPSSRSLCVVSTGEPVYRETIQDGAVLTRIAKSHLRVGTFEYAYQYTDQTALEQLVHYAIQRHYPDCLTMEHPVLEFFKSVMDKQIELILHWLRVGFIHGVMNTDNMSISGETIDYGPCAFLNAYHPQKVFSSIDRGGRYAFGNQPSIAHWNLTCLANSILPLVHPDLHTGIELIRESVDGFEEKFTAGYWKMMGNKLGFPGVEEEEKNLIQQLLDWMQKTTSDYTNTFLVLEEPDIPSFGAYTETEFREIKESLQSLRAKRGIREEDALSLMRSNNPYLIPRNHKVEDVLKEAGSGNSTPMLTWIKELQTPYARRNPNVYREEPPPQGDFGFRTFCGT